MSEHDVDPQLASALRTLHPDLPDDGFTAALRARLVPRAAPRAVDPGAGEGPWLLAIAAGLVLGAWLALALGGGTPVEAPPVPELATLGDRAAEWARLGITALLESHLYTVVAAGICAFTLLTPVLLED
jgi:hypothetical protein